MIIRFSHTFMTFWEFEFSRIFDILRIWIFPHFYDIVEFKLLRTFMIFWEFEFSRTFLFFDNLNFPALLTYEEFQFETSRNFIIIWEFTFM